ncbi:MAG TPA: TolC family protein [Acidobacteriota bacterium]|nr:TolC family protein [Acidobacteriota bacterium]
MGKNRLAAIVALAVILTIGGASLAGAQVLTLNECINIAMENYGSSQYGLPSALQSYHQSQQAVWSAWGDLLPRISHGYNYNWSRNSDVTWLEEAKQFVPIDSAGIPKTTTRWSNSFSLQQTLFDGGANLYRVAQSYHQRTARREGLRSAENNLVFGIKEGYFNLLKAIKLVEVQQAAVRRAEEFHKTIRSKYELGSASLSEVLKAEVQLGTAQLELLRRQNEVATARARLNTILGRSVDDPLDIADVGTGNPAALSYDVALQEAEASAPEVLSARAALRSAKDDIGIARATLFPSFSWSVSRSYRPRERNELIDFDGRFGTWSVGASLSFTIFGGFHRKTAISSARVGLKYTREYLKQAENAVALAVKQAHLGVELAAESRRLAEQTEASAQEDFNLAQEKYNLGAATILDLLDAQESLTRAQNDKVNALYDHFVTVAGLERAIGRGR